MADAIQIESDKKNWAKTVDDTLNSADTYWTEWSQDGVVLANGFQNAVPSDPNECLSWRNLVRRNGDIVFSEVAGRINYGGTWQGTSQVAFNLPHDVQLQRPSVIGSSAPVKNGSVLEGTVSLDIVVDGSQMKISLAGKRVDGAGDDLDGWITIHFLAC